MLIISLKLDKEMLDRIDNNLKKHNYGTRTEFIRSTLREKLDDIEKQELIAEFLSLRGKGKRKTTDAELHKTKLKVFKEYAEKLGLKS